MLLFFRKYMWNHCGLQWRYAHDEIKLVISPYFLKRKYVTHGQTEMQTW